MSSEPPNPKSIAWPVLGMLLLFLAAIYGYEAWKAQVAHGVIPATYRHAWMTPGQGFTLSALCLSVGLAAIIRWWQLSR